MSERFLQLNTENEINHEGDWLAQRYPQAFILLYFIARRARRYNGHPDGLIIGDALISSTDFVPNMSRQNFRTSIEKLVELKYIKIVSNGKSFFEREKSTIKVTITGMLVSICDTRIWDINPDSCNQQSNQRVTNGQPTGNHKQERQEVKEGLKVCQSLSVNARAENQKKENVENPLIVARHKTQNIISIRKDELVKELCSGTQLISQSEIEEALEALSENDPVLSTTIQKYLLGIIINKRSESAAQKKREAYGKSTGQQDPVSRSRDSITRATVHVRGKEISSSGWGIVGGD